MSVKIEDNENTSPDGIAVDQVKRFDIVEYGMELISNPADAAYLPSLFLIGYSRDKATKATAIVYFHESVKDGIPGYDPRSEVIYIHYPLSLFESVMNFLRSKDKLQFYWKKTGTKQWTGINFSYPIKKVDEDIHP